MLQLLFAFLAGILTIAAPCILPVLPILLGASVGQQNKQRPLLIVAGFTVSFAAVSLLLSIIITHLGLNPNLLRNIAVALLTIFAIFLIWPKPFELLMIKFSGTINSAGQIGKGRGNTSALILGLVLGIIWTPCAGPVLGSILTLIATQGSSARSTVLIIAYALGAGIPMLIIAYGGQWITTKVRWIAQYSVRLQQIFGVLILLLAATMFFQYDTKIQAALVEKFPALNLEEKLVGNTTPSPNPSLQRRGNKQSAPSDNSQSEPKIVVNGQPQTKKDIMMKIQLQNLGPAPEFAGISKWLNSDPLTIQNLKGKVVLIDFWTYSCINCIRTLPYVTRWYDTYRDKGFVVVGVHTPEFGFEKVTDNVQTAIKRFNIHYPVAQDNDFATWNAYSNQYWPAEYLIDKNGNIVYTHFGEGNYDHTENVIRQLLGLDQSDVGADSIRPLQGNIQSPEMYFGTDRLEYLTPAQSASLQPTSYQLPPSLKLNQFAIEGQWRFDGDKAVLLNPNGKIRLHFSSGKIFMVAASSNKAITMKVVVDGKPQADVTVTTSQLYTLFDSTDYSEHTIDIEIPDAGFEAFTFTFG